MKQHSFEKEENQQDALQKKEKKRPYAPPRILSDEPLEAIASTCNSSTPGGFGKTAIPNCAGGYGS